MPGKEEVTALMRKKLGKKAADKVLKNLDAMIKRRMKRAQIEKQLINQIGDCIAKQICEISRSQVKGGVLIVSRLSSVRTPISMKTGV